MNSGWEPIEDFPKLLVSSIAGFTGFEVLDLPENVLYDPLLPKTGLRIRKPEKSA